MTKKMTKVVTDIDGCARCGGTHRLAFKPFKNGRPVAGFGFWAMCPTNQEPILMKVENKAKRDKNDA